MIKAQTNKELLAKAMWEFGRRKMVEPIKYFEPQDYQKQFFDSDSRNKNIFGGNRSGKSLSGAVYLIKLCLEKKTDAWACTWADLSTPVQQLTIYRYLPKNDEIKYARYSEQTGFTHRIITFRNGSKIRFKTYEQGRESFQGTSKDIIWLDEEPPEDIVKECKARLIDRNGELVRTMTPLNGISYTYDEVILNEKNIQDIQYWHWSNTDNRYINQTALENILSQYPTKEAEVRRHGHFLNLTVGTAYYPFEAENVIKSFQYMQNRPLEISCDFNVGLMCWNISQEFQGKDYTFDFVELEGQANTDLMCQMIKNKYPQHKGGFVFYGDISGSQRTPETSRTNWAIIREHFPNADIFYQNIKNIKDRVDSLNGRLKNAQGNYWYITENCRRLLKDLRQVTWEMLLNKNKAGMLTHTSDGLTYQAHWKYPLSGKVMVKQW